MQTDLANTLDIPQALHDYLYENQYDLQRHVRSMHAIAEDFSQPLEEVAPLYETVLAQLTLHAKIRDFLHILVPKKIKEIYKGKYCISNRQKVDKNEAKR